MDALRVKGTCVIRQDSQSGYSDSKLVASQGINQTWMNRGLNHTAEDQFVNWQFYNKRCNCRAASKLVPEDQYFFSSKE
jgi:hypothetical protein